MNEFWQELWNYAYKNAINLPTNLIRDIHAIGRCINNKKSSDFAFDPYAGLTWCCRDVAKKLKKKLPNSLHNRMVLGDQNEYTKDYVKKWGV